jgi:hypothetical protein
MSDTVNPWQSPEAPVQADENAAQGILTALMIRYLKEASPWLRFIGILGYIGAIFLIVSGVGMVAALLITGINGLTGGYNEPGFVGLVSGLFSSMLGFIYVVLGIIAFFPARFTHGFGVKIRNYLLSGSEKDLEEALKNNRSLWRFNGILAIVYLSLIPVGIVAAIIAAVSQIF